MNLEQTFIPTKILKEGEKFLNNGQVLQTTKVNFIIYAEEALSDIARQERMYFSDEETGVIQRAAALLEALTIPQLYSPEDFSTLPVLKTGQHAMTIFDGVGNLQFANAPYLANLGVNLSDVRGISADELMHKLYTPATIADFKMVQEYTARYITMDKIPGAPTYVWHKQQFTGSDGQTSEIRIGMNTSGLSPAQKNLLDQFYQLTDKLRTPDFIDISYYDNPSSELLLEKIKDKTYRLLNTTDPLKQQFHWLEMLLNMASEIIRNSPLPITIADQDGNIRNISPAYAAGTGYTIAQIGERGFYQKIYPEDDIHGVIAQMNIAQQAQTGRFPEGTSFRVHRGQEFAGLETELGIHDFRKVILEPDPHTLPTCLVRINSLKLE